MIQSSRYLSVSASCAIALCVACGRGETRHTTHDALPQPAVENTLEGPTPLSRAPLAPTTPEPPAPEHGASVASSPEVGARDEETGEVDGAAAPGRPGAVPVLNQLLTTQALLVSLLLTPLAKAPPELPPLGSERAPLESTRATEPRPAPRPSIQKLMQSRAPFGAAG